jgi:branched-chain amino acid transport system substrate-binding protein
MISFRRISALVAGVALALAARGALAAPQPYEIGAILSVTGSAGFAGGEQKKALLALGDYVNRTGGIGGRPVKFTVYDDTTNPQIAVQLATQLMQRGVNVIIGPDLVANCRAVAPLIVNGPVTYCTSPGAPIALGGTYMFAASTGNHDVFKAAARYFHDRGWRRIALLAPTDATGQEGESSLVDTLALPANRELQLVATEHFNTTDISVAAQIARLKQANPQVLLAWTSGASLGNVLHAAIDAGLEIPIMTTSANTTFAQMDQLKDYLPNGGLYFPGPMFFARNTLRPGATRNAIDAFMKSLRDAGTEPIVPHTFTWDPALIVVDALRHLGPNASARALHDYLEHLHGFVGVNGSYDFRDGSQRGLGASSVLLVRWDREHHAFVAASEPGGKPL